MEYRRIGKTGLKVSSVSIGGWITMGGTIDDKTSHGILKKSIDLGINFIDLADIYAKGEAESVAGKLLVDYQRSDLVLSSKVFWPMSDNPNDRGLSRKHIMESCEKSLKRLKTDYLDMYFCHRFDEETPLEETLRAMDDLVRQGKILYWGTSVWSSEQLSQAHRVSEKYGAYKPVVEQPRYNLLDREIESSVMGTCTEEGMGLVVWSPLAQGLLAGRYDEGVPENSRASTTSWLSDSLNEENLVKSRQFSELSKDLGYTPSQVALAWCLRRPEISSVITGASSPSQVESNVAAAQIQLSSEDLVRIDTIFA